MELAKDVAVVVGMVVALWGLLKGMVEFVLQGKQKRAEIFLKKQAEYFGNKSFNELRQLIEHDSEALREHAFEDKRAYLTFFEEVALLTNSGLINRRLAYYMFGYYATRCLESNNFWSNVNRDDIFWNVFNRFAQDMQTRLRQHHEVVAHDLQV